MLSMKTAPLLTTSSPGETPLRIWTQPSRRSPIVTPRWTKWRLSVVTQAVSKPSGSRTTLSAGRAGEATAAAVRMTKLASMPGFSWPLGSAISERICKVWTVGSTFGEIFAIRPSKIWPGQAETLTLTDRSYIIFSGQVLMEGAPADIIADAEVRRVYLGERFSL